MTRRSPIRPSSSVRSTPRRRHKRLAHVRRGRSARMERPGGVWWPLPSPRLLIEIAIIAGCWPTESVAICAGGGGIPVRRNEDGKLHGVEAVVDKDLTAALLAWQLDADALVLLTDVAGIVARFRHGIGPGHPAGRLPRHSARCTSRPGRWVPRSKPSADSWRQQEAGDDRPPRGRPPPDRRHPGDAGGTRRPSSRRCPVTGLPDDQPHR